MPGQELYRLIVDKLRRREMRGPVLPAVTFYSLSMPILELTRCTCREGSRR